MEARLGIAQRAGKKARVKAIHTKIGFQRKDMLHKFSNALVRENAAIFVGDVSSANCGAVHDRDVNAARNILALGHERLAGGIPFKVA